MTISVLWWLAGSCLIALSALALERAASFLSLPRRAVWLLAIALVVITPFVLRAGRTRIVRYEPVASVDQQRPVARPAPTKAVAPVAPAAMVLQRGADGRLVTAYPRMGRVRTQLVALDPWVALFSLVASCCLALAFVVAVIRTRIARARWSEGQVDDVPVLVSDDIGPAVVGIWRPRVVLPRWALEFEPGLRALLLNHEREHIRAGDPRTLIAAATAVVLFPWNAALWWMVHRLRLAIEIDCDARVISAMGSAKDYGRMLLAVGKHRARPLPFAPALVDGASGLARRIDAMTATRPRRPVVASMPFIAGAIIALAAVVIAPRPEILSANVTVAFGLGKPPWAASAFDFERQVGVADFKTAAAGCLAIMNDTLAPGQRVTVASMHGETSAGRVSEATIVAKTAAECTDSWGVRGMGGLMTPTFYTLKRTADTTRPPLVLVAMVAPIGTVDIRAGRVVGDLDGDGVLESFRKCASGEGLHYTLWTGVPLEGRIRWHRYVYVGYDLVYTCTDSETPDPSKPLPVVTPPPSGRFAAPVPERDILEMAAENPLNVVVNSRIAPYGDPALAAAVGRLADLPHPWTVPRTIQLFEAESAAWLANVARARAARSNNMWPTADRDRHRIEDLATILAASRDPRAAVVLGRTIDKTDFPNERVLTEMFDYFVGDINYGLPPEQWLGPVAGFKADYAWPAVRRWWAANRARLEAKVR